MFIGDRNFKLLNPDITFDDAPDQDGTIWKVKYDNNKLYVQCITDTDAPEGVAVFGDGDADQFVDIVEEFYFDSMTDEVENFISQIKKLTGILTAAEAEELLEGMGYDIFEIEYEDGDSDGVFYEEFGGV